jgi:GNAT superfamily N-acetyltransferase
MTRDDVGACVATWHEAWYAMRERYALPVPPRSREADASMARRIAHLQQTDPAGSVVGCDGDRVVGFAQALVRDDLWVLSLFGVAPGAQNRGAGRALLDAAMECGDGRRGLILSSRDPNAMRRYAAAGFDLHPGLTAHGVLTPGALRPAPPGCVVVGGAADLDAVARVDDLVRGARHGRADLQLLLDEGARLLLHASGDGYTFVTGKPLLLAATHDAVATDLLRAALALVPAGATTEVNWMTASTQWAIRVAVEAGLELHPVGPLCLRGFGAPPAAYLPTGAFG